MPEQSLIPGRQQVALAAEDRKKNACSRPEWVSLRLQMVVGEGPSLRFIYEYSSMLAHLCNNVHDFTLVTSRRSLGFSSNLQTCISLQ